MHWRKEGGVTQSAVSSPKKQAAILIWRALDGGWIRTRPCDKAASPGEKLKKIKIKANNQKNHTQNTQKNVTALFFSFLGMGPLPRSLPHIWKL